MPRNVSFMRITDTFEINNIEVHQCESHFYAILYAEIKRRCLSKILQYWYKIWMRLWNEFNLFYFYWDLDQRTMLVHQKSYRLALPTSLTSFLTHNFLVSHIVETPKPLLDESSCSLCIYWSLITRRPEDNSTSKEIVYNCFSWCLPIQSIFVSNSSLKEMVLWTPGDLLIYVDGDGNNAVVDCL